MLLNRCQGFANSRPEAAGNASQRIQDLFFPGRLRLLLIDHISGAAILRLQAQDVLAAQIRNRTFKDSGAAGALANLLRNFRRKACIWPLAH